MYEISTEEEGKLKMMIDVEDTKYNREVIHKCREILEKEIKISRIRYR